MEKFNPPTIKQISRDNAMRRIDALLPETIKSLFKKEYCFSDKMICLTKEIIGKGEIEFRGENFYFIPTHINLLMRTGEDKATEEYGIIDAETANGEFEIRAYGKPIMDRNNSLEMFRHDIKREPEIDFPLIEISSPKWLEPNKEAHFVMKIILPDASMKRNFKLVMFGQIVIPY